MAINNLVSSLKVQSGDLISKLNEGKIKGGIAQVSDEILGKSKKKSLIIEKAKMYEFIGMEIYDLYRAGEMNIEVIEPFCKKIEVINDEITALESQSAKTCDCGAALSPKNKFCPTCGKNFTISTVVEQQPISVATCVCGAVVEDGTLMCMECGRRITLS